MAGAMLLATAACWWENCVTVTLTITNFKSTTSLMASYTIPVCVQPT